MSNDIFKNYLPSSEYIISPQTNNNQADYRKVVKESSTTDSQRPLRDYKIDDQHYGQAKARKKIVGYVKK